MRTTDSVHTRLTGNTAELITLLPRVERELPEKRRNPYGGFGTAKGGHAQLAAWNTQAAYLILDVHLGARELELNLRYSITGSVWIRGGSEENTLTCLRGLPALAAGAPHDVAVTCIRKTESWIYRARLILGEAEPLSRLPRLPGEAEPACPFCKRAGTLRVRHQSGVVACLRPDCKDGDGKRPLGRIELGQFSGEPLIQWSDGSIGVAA